MSLTVGQKLWFVYSDRRRGNSLELTVTKVGRKWASTCSSGWPESYRINIETLRADGGQYTSPGRAYLSREAYEAELAVDTAWRNLKRWMDGAYSPPSGISIVDIASAAALLRAPIKEG